MPKHGDTKELTVIKDPSKQSLGGSIVKLGDKINGWWDKEADYGKGKWKIDYNNGFVGWWADSYFHYEGKGFLYNIDSGGHFISPVRLFHGVLIDIPDTAGVPKYFIVRNLIGDTAYLDAYSMFVIKTTPVR